VTLARRAIPAALALIAVTWGAPVAASTRTTACDRACLVGIADAYLAALVAHRPSSTDLARRPRITENAVDEAPGLGLWRSAEATPSRQVFADPSRGQVATFGTVRRDGRLAALMVRLKVVGRRISEAEMLVGGDVDGPYAAASNLLRPDVLYDAPVPVPRGSSRRALVGIADAYFTALERHDGALAPFSERCDRYEAGARVTNSTRMIGAPDGGVFTCAESLEAAKGVKVEVNERRFPVVDPDRGLVVVIDFLEPRMADGSKRSLYLAAVFKIVDGEIRGLDEINTPVTPGARTGFKP
jgi:hypothetical protein